MGGQTTRPIGPGPDGAPRGLRATVNWQNLR